MSSIFDDRFNALGEPWARDADDRLAIRARAQRRLAEWALDESDRPIDDKPGTVRRLLKAGFEPTGEVAFLQAVSEQTGIATDILANRVEDFAREVEARKPAETGGD